ADETVMQQILEISTDGRNFQTLVQPSNADRSYIYRPYNTALAKYRLNVTFNNGRQYYSNIIAIKPDENSPRPFLNGNLIRSGAMVVNSPGNYDYVIMDANGKIFNKGKLNNGVNNINAAALTSGMYLIRFSDNSQQWTDKFMRQ
ncbi:MAG TPA: T9SS type A sorting domain-containing protein, partial [Chitinophagaceae bacterium]|nr:T9SS type A sorting domain-containing protein [Chitinophagaceae bacterium]